MIKINIIISLLSFGIGIINSNYSKITLKVEKSGNIKIFYDNGCKLNSPIPDQVYINGEEK